jgi:hypothetical protein
MLRSAALASALALVFAGGASAEVVARGVQDGLLALNAKGVPSVAYVKGTTFAIAGRAGPQRWTTAKAATVTARSSVVAFAVGPAGPVALVQSADQRTLLLVRARSVGWQTIRLAGGLPAQVRLGWPGLAVNHRGEIAVAYTRWNSVTLNSRLMLVRLVAKAPLRSQQVTFEGFPKSLVPPPAVPVFFGGLVHVIESYGYHGVLGTLEWFPQNRTWLGLNLDAGVGDFPLGPVLAGVSPDGVLHAAWTEALTYFGTAPVTLANRKREATSDFVLDRGLTTALALPATGPEVGANEWVAADELGLGGDANTWAGTIVRGRSLVELDGWLAGLSVAPRGGRDVLLGGTAGLRWFHSPRRLMPRVTIEAFDDGGTVALSGHVRGIGNGSVTIYRERPGEARKAIGRPALSAGSFSLSAQSSAAPAVYRAVWTDPGSGIPYAALSRPG